MTTEIIPSEKLAAAICDLKARGFHVTGMKVEQPPGTGYTLEYVEDWEKRPKIPQPELFPACNPDTGPPR